MAIQFVQIAGTATATTASLSVPVSAQTTQGNTLIACIRAASGATVSNVTDSKGNMWSADVQASNTGVSPNIWRCTLSSALGTTDTVTVGFSKSQVGYAELIELSPGGLILDQTANVDTTSGTSPTATTATTPTTTQPSELALSVAASGNTSKAFTPPSGWTEASGFSGLALDVAYESLSSTQAVTATWSQQSATNLGVLIATYYVAIGGAVALQGAGRTSSVGSGTPTMAILLRGLGATGSVAAASVVIRIPLRGVGTSSSAATAGLVVRVPLGAKGATGTAGLASLSTGGQPPTVCYPTAASLSDDISSAALSGEVSQAVLSGESSTATVGGYGSALVIGTYVSSASIGTY